MCNINMREREWKRHNIYNTHGPCNRGAGATLKMYRYRRGAEPSHNYIIIIVVALYCLNASEVLPES